MLHKCSLKLEAINSNIGVGITLKLLAREHASSLQYCFRTCFFRDFLFFFFLEIFQGVLMYSYHIRNYRKLFVQACRRQFPEQQLSDQL